MDDCTTLLIGLGNPGREYEGNRHNLGFIVVEEIAKVVAFGSFKGVSSLVEVSSFFFENQRVILAKPQTFMNLSGKAVRFLVDFFKIPLCNVRVFHDDLDLPFGTVKVKKGGGSGGHNGLKSIDSLVGNDYWRIRVGIGRPEKKSMIVPYVLSDFSGEESEKISSLSKVLTENLRLLLSDNVKNLESILNS